MINNDWHSADIIAALKKQGTTLAAESRKAGYASCTLANALARPWTKGEQIIANVLNIPPEKIWPSRYLDRSRTVRVTNRKNGE